MLQIATALSISLAQESLQDAALDHRLPAHRVECIACNETLPPSSLPPQAITSSCDHSSADRIDSRICLSCLSEHLRVQLESNGPDSLSCPICYSRFEYGDVRRWTSEDAFRRYDSLKARSAMQSDGNFVECSAGCGAGQLHTGGVESPIVICHRCGARTCFVHQNARWHKGLTCHEFDNPAAAEERRRKEAAEEEEVRRHAAEEEGRQRREEEEKERKRQQEKELAVIRHQEEERAKRRKEEVEGEAEVLSSSKPCPGPRCTYRVTKTTGCKHISCTRCSYEWCYICLKPWVSGHLAVACG
jgi:hypothetical protein